MMKPRHAAALALVGWCIMWPDVRRGVTYKSPLSEWDSSKEFKSQDVCEHQMESDRKYWTELTKDGDRSSVTMGIAPYVIAVLDRKAVCVRRDDPRLKSK